MTTTAPRTTWRFKITAAHLMENLGARLYASLGACLWEIVRNGVCACMPGETWVPRTGDVEVSLVRNHPMNPKGMSLVVFDRGSGFTEPAIERFCNIGPSLVDARGNGSHSGAAQKRIGRFAALALNTACTEEHDPNAGFYIFTRTAGKGPVRFIRIIPADIERQQGVEYQELDLTASELGPQRSIAGSFTAVVIPNPPFQNTDEIREALQWHVPRKQEHMFRCLIGGKPLMPPPLPDKLTHVEPGGDHIEAYLDRLSEAVSGHGGIWLADLDTGLRVAHAPRLLSFLPFVLTRSDLVGDIFLPGLLANQDTARGSLTQRFLRSAAWKRAVLYLNAQVVPKVKSLLGDDDVFGKGPIDTLAALFAKASAAIFGAPDTEGGPIFDLLGVGSSRKRTGGGHGKGGGGGSGGGGTGEEKKRPRVLPIRVGDQTYFLSRMPLNELTLAEVNVASPRVIHLNPGHYAAMPKQPHARAEHFLLMVLGAVGRAEYPEDPGAVTRFVAEHRRNFLGHF